jgi:hypothetical protein
MPMGGMSGLEDVDVLARTRIGGLPAGGGSEEPTGVAAGQWAIGRGSMGVCCDFPKQLQAGIHPKP